MQPLPHLLVPAHPLHPSLPLSLLKHSTTPLHMSSIPPKHPIRPLHHSPHHMTRFLSSHMPRPRKRWHHMCYPHKRWRHITYWGRETLLHIHWLQLVTREACTALPILRLLILTLGSSLTQGRECGMPTCRGS